MADAIALSQLAKVNKIKKVQVLATSEAIELQNSIDNLLDMMQEQETQLQTLGDFNESLQDEIEALELRIQTLEG